MNYGYTAGGGYMQTNLLGYDAAPRTASPSAPYSSGNTGAAWMQGASGAFGLAGTIIGIYERHKADKASAQAQYNAYIAQSGSLLNQAGLYGQQAGMFARQSEMYREQAGMFAKAAGAYAASGERAEAIGRANAAETMRQSAQLDLLMQYQLQAVDKERRAKIGEGRAAFAANGVLVEGRDGSATAMWERDEMADAAIEKLAIQQSFENEYYNYRIKAKGQIVEGLLAKANYQGQAAGAFAQGAGAAGNALAAAAQGGASALQMRGAIDDAAYAQRLASEAAPTKKRKFTWADAITIGSQAAQGAAAVAMFL